MKLKVSGEGAVHKTGETDWVVVDGKGRTIDERSNFIVFPVWLLYTTVAYVFKFCHQYSTPLEESKPLMAFQTLFSAYISPKNLIIQLATIASVVPSPHRPFANSPKEILYVFYIPTIKSIDPEILK